MLNFFPKNKRIKYFIAGLAVIIFATAFFSWLAIASHPNAPTQSSMSQYGADTTASLPNGSYLNQSTVNFTATSTDPNNFFPGLYYQLASTSGSFITSTTTPANACSTNTAYGSCASKVWTNSTASTSSWYNQSFPYRIKITVLSAKVGAGLTFPYPVYLNMANVAGHNKATGFWQHTKKNSDGGDIVITNSTGTRLPVEVVALSTSTPSGEVYFGADSLSDSVNTVFYLYYGSSTASQPAVAAAYGRNAVWSNGYTVVQHFQNTSGTFVNSVGNSEYNGTASGTPFAGAGIFGNCLTFPTVHSYKAIMNHWRRGSTRLIWAGQALAAS